MNPRLMMLAVATVLIAADVPKDDAAKKEKEELQDTWSHIEVEKDGQKVHLTGRCIITGDTILLFGLTESWVVSYKLDTTAKPRAIDVTITEGEHKGEKWQGIYSLRGDKLKMCFNKNGKGRPKVFATFKGEENVQYFLTRE